MVMQLCTALSFSFHSVTALPLSIHQVPFVATVGIVT